MLTEEQVAHFRTFGFVVQRQLFSPEEMEAISSDFDEVMGEAHKGEPFTGQKTHSVIWFLERKPSLTRLADDDRIYNVVEQLIGPDPLWVLSDAHLFVGDTQWHSATDGALPVLDHVKIVMYPDRLTKDTGCLRVIPGSHLPKYQRHLRPLKKQYDDPEGTQPFGVAGTDVPAYAFESQPGDVIFASENLWHASFGGSPGRRMFNMNIYENPTTDEQVQYIRDERPNNTAMFHPHEVFLNSDRPRIRGMVQKYVDLGLA